jgi:hypothetical protein
LTYKMEAEAFRARGDTAQLFIQNGSWSPTGTRAYGTNLHTKWKLKPSGQEGIRHKCTYRMEAGLEGIRHKFIYKTEAGPLWARGYGTNLHTPVQKGS